MHVNQIYELSMILESEPFNEIANEAYNDSDNWTDDEDQYIDRSFMDKGMTVHYRNSRYKKKVKLIFDGSQMFHNTECSPDDLVRKIEKRISKYFNDKFTIDDFALSKMSVATSIELSSQKQVNAYINILHRLGKVKGFSPVIYDALDPNISFSLDGNSNGIQLSIYDLQKVIKAHFKESDSVPAKAQLLIDDAYGVLQVEIGLKAKAIQAYTNELDIRSNIMQLSTSREKILLDILTRIIPPGMSFKKFDTIEIICKKITKQVLRRKMIQLVALIPQKKSLLLAQKAMNYRKIGDVMEAFEKLDLSPVTIGKRQKVQYLDSIYDYL